MVFCDDDTCTYCDGTGCGRKDINIVVTPGGMKSGCRIVYNECANYKEKENAGAD